MVFPNSVLLGQNLAEILFLLWLAFWTKKLQKHNWKRIPYGIAEKNSKKTQRLTHLWPKARSSFFSEWTVVIDFILLRSSFEAIPRFSILCILLTNKFFVMFSSREYFRALDLFCSRVTFLSFPFLVMHDHDDVFGMTCYVYVTT